MKKTMLIGLLSLAACYHHAQAQPYFTPNATPVSQTLFSPTEPGKQLCNFFVWLPEKNRIWFDLTWVSHLQKLNNVDSILGKTAHLLDPLLDSFLADGYLRRIEVDLTQNPALFRVTTHTQKPKAYTRLEGELTQVKVDQDTIRIKYMEDRGSGCFINLLLNNVADIRELPPGAGNQSLKLVKDGLAKEYSNPIKNNPRHTYYAVYNLETGALVSPGKENYHAIRSQSDYLEITVLKPSLGYARGKAIAGFSFGAAVNYSITRNSTWGSRHSLGLYWEPQFTFSSDAQGKMIPNRNDFLTFRFQETPNKPPAQFELMSTFSVSYLIRRSGTVFEKNTFRLGLLGLASGRLHLEPELYFNDFFKNVSPGIRLSMKLL